MPFIAVSVTGQKLATVQLSSFAATIHDWSGYWDSVEKYLNRRAKEIFDTEGRSHKVPWAPLSPAYARRKAREGFGSEKILVRTGAMKSSVLGTGGNRLQTIRKRSQTRYIWGSSHPLVSIHQRGSKASSRLPARPMIVLTKEDVKNLVQQAADYIRGQEAKAGMILPTFISRGPR